MADPNLTGALRASLKVIENQAQEGELSGDSPLLEATPDSIDVLLDRINEAMAAGLPGTITDETLLQLCDGFRAQALRWNQEEQQKPKRQRKSHAEAVEITL